MKKFILFSICISMIGYANALPLKRNGLTDPPDKKVNSTYALGQILSGMSYDNPPTLGTTIGSMGLGIEGQIPLVYSLQLRTGATVLPFEVSHNYIGFPSRDVDVKMDGTVAKFHLFADWQPFPDAYSRFFSKIAITGGVAYFISAKGTAQMKLKDPYYYGDIELSPDDVGELTAVSDWKGFAPYAGIQINRLKIADWVSMGIAAGAFHLSSPSVSLTGTNLLSDNYQNQEQLRRNMDKYFRWLPMLQFSFNYSINW